VPTHIPYYVANFINGEHVSLKRNPNYHGTAPRPSMHWSSWNESERASPSIGSSKEGGTVSPPCPIRYSTSTVKLTGGGGPGSAAAAKGDQRYFVTPLPGTRFVDFNASRGIFADPRVRRAAALALNRSALAATWRQSPRTRSCPWRCPGTETATSTL